MVGQGREHCGAAVIENIARLNCYILHNGQFISEQGLYRLIASILMEGCNAGQFPRNTTLAKSIVSREFIRWVTRKLLWSEDLYTAKLSSHDAWWYASIQVSIIILPSYNLLSLVSLFVIFGCRVFFCHFVKFRFLISCVPVVFQSSISMLQS